MSFSDLGTQNASDTYQSFSYNHHVGTSTTPAELAQRMDKFEAAGLALVIQMERMRVAEVIAARDTVVERLEDAYISVRQKTATIDQLQREIDNLRRSSTPAASVERDDDSPAQLPVQDIDIPQPAPVDVTHAGDVNVRSASAQAFPWLAPLDRPGTGPPLTPPPDLRSESQCDSNSFSPSFQSNYCARLENNSDSRNSETVDSNPPNILEPLPPGDGPEELILARQAFLATLPLPANIPDDALNPILIPPPYTLHEFLSNASGSLKSSLSNYRVLGQLTTYWCPEREEHGYLITPVFKCSTNPRVTTAHRWTAVDVIGTMSRPTECFYNKDGKWYYAGVYKAFRMDDLTTQEWEALSTETTQTLIKETLAGRKNLSPQNLYETGQLYAAGALRIACIGLQCVGFSSAMYRAVLEQATLGKWRGIGWSGPTASSSSDTTIEGDGIPGP
ncbi:hypothetical protein DEU56DRAFT_980433 [Suillus clintonianus]|uniref:uncharacterized protein n=1 Tax=Suillus clintonianus TaxID=1904413 RepID=UPI001B87628B|nr:uncharacterized protein DEU56DRAFT_980433 [Suillus clintonianus]KAG2139042.1 hypothetical protein DEU56DRAFT_980433 [Suillus clintonianus]